MSEITQRKSVPLWIQIIVWVFIAGLLVLVGSTLSKRQQGTIQPGDKVSDFSLSFSVGMNLTGRVKQAFLIFLVKWWY
ncbi:MAG: hypothetical protein HC797_08820 [Anaerolineales bacterium]|nr:hypothetical protein [Anaerolineales bacterium]